MIKAILLDLDDTLIRNPTDSFLANYFRLVDSHFTRLWGERPYARMLVNGVLAVMHRPRDMVTRNLDLILSAIESEVQLDKPDILAALDEFYGKAYDLLRNCVAPVEGATALIHTLRAYGYTVVIATNPVYPLEAIRQRMAWGGLPESPEHYALITSAENMHFAKPSPAYYAEILGRVGVEPDEAIMVGDSLENDIRAASQLGIHTFHVTPDSDGGGLSAFTASLPTLDTLVPILVEPAMIEPQLRGNIGALYGLIDRMQPHFWHQHPDPDEWSPIEIICHLLEHEVTVHRTRLIRIMDEDNPFIAAPPLPPGPRETIPCGQDGMEVVERLVDERQKTLDLIASVPEPSWTRPARHSIFGPTTLLEMAHFTAQHDRLHLNQLCQTIGGCA